ncbi:hypothetical protein KDA_67010 [Dictyobacter alpinus]|uniref:Uncharacterized protein n=1 Tax=Dictyobacter alpinus TaxID=2014873 RepID=A0A402BIX1_9CHLR|nr:hypothetical protein KDA_67010 [Dictyobacter alpinus]
MCNISLQKVHADCPGYLLRGLFIDPKVVEFWKLLCFRSWEYRCQPLHGHIYPCAIAFPSIHEEDIGRYFLIVFITTVKPSYFLMLAQIFREEIEHLLSFVDIEEEQK